MLPCAIRRRSAGGDMSTSSIWSAAHHLVRDRLLLPYAGYRLDEVAQRLQVLDVDGRDDVDAGGEQFLHVLPALDCASPARWCGRARRPGRQPGLDAAPRPRPSP